MKVDKNINSNKKGSVQKVSENLNIKNVGTKKEKSSKISKVNASGNVKAQAKELKTKQKTENQNKKGKLAQKPTKDKIQSKDVVANDAETAKIEKKKAKKLAKKLKKEESKKQKQAEIDTHNQSTPILDNKERKGRDTALDAATVFVGNLPVTTKRVQIVKLFAKFGGVKGIRLRTAAGQVIFKHKQRKQAGSLNAYVVLNNSEAANKALELNGQEFKGVHLRVTPSDAEKIRKDHDPKRTVFVGNLKYTANEEKLREIFSNCGEIDYIRCLYGGENKCKGVGYVCFKSPEAVGLAMELNETVLDERPIHVERYSTKKLGAKEARDKEASANQKTGAKKRIDSKNKVSQDGSNEVKDKKKSEFRGVKVSGIKKKNKKKPTNEMKTIAKKIAPMTKTKKE